MILALETSTKSCSVALFDGNSTRAAIIETTDAYIHSEKLHLFIKQVLEQSGVKPGELKAVAVGKGPGSYTGLRIGVSAAKGLCYSLNIPLISEDGPRILVQEFLNKHKAAKQDILLPMIDARRMEVYMAVHEASGRRQDKIRAEIIGEDFPERFGGQTLHLFGDGAEKCRKLFEDKPDIHVYSDVHPTAEALARLAYSKMNKQQFEDVAYFEPFYLKDFTAIKPKNPFA